MRTGAGWMRVIGAASSGLVTASLVPPLDWSGLVWISLVPLLVALWSLEGRRAGWKGFGLGMLAGTISFAVQLSWLAVVSPLGAFVLPLYLGAFWGLFGMLAATWGNPWRGEAGGIAKSLRTAASLGAVWAGLEWLRGWLFTGFGWNGLGVAFHETLVVAQAADLLGVAGLSLLVVFFQAVLVQAGRRVLDGARDGKRRTRWDFAVAVMVVGAVVCYGIVRTATVGSGGSVRLKTLLVQLNIPQDAAVRLWDEFQIRNAYEEETLGALEDLEKADAERFREALGSADEGEVALRWPDWVLWPESALPGRLLRTETGDWGAYPQDARTLSLVREPGPFTLIYGINELEAVPHDDGLVYKEGGRIYNSLVTLTPEDELRTFRKHHLVIFGETIPFADSIPLLRKIYEQQAGVAYGGSFTPGGVFEPLPARVGHTTVGIIPSVCFEDTVPRLKRRFLRDGPQVIVNVTNDGWFKESAAAAQHFANARFRAIELRRPMLRCANTGVTAAVDAAGSTAHPDTGSRQVLVDASGSHFTRGTLFAELDIPLDPPATLYGLIGDWGVVLLGFAGFGIIVATRPRVAKKRGDF